MFYCIMRRYNVTYRHSGFEVERTHHQDAVCPDFSCGFTKVTRHFSSYIDKDNHLNLLNIILFSFIIRTKNIIELLLCTRVISEILK